MNRFSRMNIGFLAVSAFFLICYVIQANGIATQVWRIRDAQQQLAALSEERNGLVAQEATLDDRQQLLELAQQSGMVPAGGTVVYLVQNQPVAAR
jgi:hypothetical protein